MTRREKEIQKIINEKQALSEREFKMKKEVLNKSFNEHVAALIDKIRRQKEVITNSYGPIVLDSKKIEKPIF